MQSTPIELQSGFEGLATETILAVLNHITDLATLHSLINASPVVFRLFKEYGVEITESVLISGSITKRIPEIIRLIALIRSSSLPIHGLQEFHERVVLQSMIQQRSQDAFLPRSFPTGTPHVILRSILASAHRISRLTPDCLRHYLNQLATIEPEALVDENFHYWLGHRPGHATIAAWKMRPEGRKVAIGKLEPPSWAEVQRVERAFWRVQFFYDLKIAAAKSIIDWPREDIERLEEMEEPRDLYNKPSLAENEEINTIVDYIQRLRIRDRSGSQHVRWFQLPSPHFELAKDSPMPAFWADDHDDLLIPAPAYSQWRSLSSRKELPLRYVPFEPFKKLGFALWSRERMASLGFMNPNNPKDGARSIEYYAFTWKSILTAPMTFSNRR